MFSNIARNLGQQIVKSNEPIKCSQARSISSMAQKASTSKESGKGSLDCQEVLDVVMQQLKNKTARERYHEKNLNLGRAATEARDKEGLLLMKTYLEHICPKV